MHEQERRCMGNRICLSMEQREATERFMRQVEDAGLRTGKRPKVPNHLCVELSALDDQKFRSSRISPCLFMAVIHRHPFAHQATKESTSTDAQSTRKRSCKKKISTTVRNAAIFSHDLVELSRGLFQIHNTDKHQSVPLFRAYQYCYILHRPFQACFPISREPVPYDL